MKQFVDRYEEMLFLEEQYKSAAASMLILYGRRRLGKTSLIHEFVKSKPYLYYLATEEAERLNIRAFKDQVAEYTGDALLAQAEVNNWEILFQALMRTAISGRLVIVLDEFQYLGKTNPAFPSVFQRIWDNQLQHQNVMVILCGSLVHMMQVQTLNYSSPLYGRRTGQIKLRQIGFEHYSEFFDDLPYKSLIEHYAVTGGVPRYIELFDGREDIYEKIERNILNKQSPLFEEPVFLFQNEVSEIGSYFSVMKSIAAGNRRLGKICADLGVKETSMPKYLKTLIDLDAVEREVPVTENNPKKSKMGLYRIKDPFLRFWFRFIYPEKSRLELSDKVYAISKIRSHFIDSHTAYIYESICKSEMWRLAGQWRLNFNKLGRWWNNKEEIDVVGLDSDGDEIIFGECKYQNKPVDVDVFASLMLKKEQVIWKNDIRRERFVIFSISGFTEPLKKLALQRGDLILFTNP